MCIIIQEAGVWPRSGIGTAKVAQQRGYLACLLLVLVGSHMSGCRYRRARSASPGRLMAHEAGSSRSSRRRSSGTRYASRISFVWGGLAPIMKHTRRRAREEGERVSRVRTSRRWTRHAAARKRTGGRDVRRWSHEVGRSHRQVSFKDIKTGEGADCSADT